MPPPPEKNLLLIGASRGLGLALAEEYLRRGWQVVATERDGSHSRLHQLADTAQGRLTIETVDIVEPGQRRQQYERAVRGLSWQQGRPSVPRLPWP